MKFVQLIFIVLGFYLNTYSQVDNRPISPCPNCLTYYTDSDGDDFGTFPSYLWLEGEQPTGLTLNPGDCNDNDISINPNTRWYLDADGDTYGDPLSFIYSCTPIAGRVRNQLDCDDSTALINPNTRWYLDSDGDSYGSSTLLSIQCEKPVNGVSNNSDCNDTIASLSAIPRWYIDADVDGFGENSYQDSCLPIVGYVLNNSDLCPSISGPNNGCVAPVADSSGSFGFSNNMNFIISSSPKFPTTNLQTIADKKDVIINITYFDELGRPIQKIANQQSSSDNDIVTPIEYDVFGRQVKEYLPYASTVSSLNYVSSALTDVGTFYNTTVYDNTTNPFSEKQLEASPLNRVLQQAAPGNDWAMTNNQTIKLDYQTNTATEVILYTATATWDATKGLYDIVLGNTNGITKYAANELYKTITKDENWKTTDVKNNTTEEFKNKEGQVVLKSTYNNRIRHDTYYVYDQYGNLTYVIPPLVDTSTTIIQSVLDNLCYQYRYDYRNRLVEKKLPGKQWEFIVYDKLNRIVATGPALAPFSNLQTIPPATPIVGWIITKYDAFNRPVYTGWVQSTTVTSAGRKTMQTTQNSLTTTLNESKTTATTTIDGTITNYSNAVNPKTFKLLTVNYYDDYNYPSAPTVFNTVLSDNSGNVFYNNTTNKPIGLPTGSWVRVPELSTTTPKKAEISYTLYDSKARAIRTRTTNYLGGYIQIDTKLDFIGKVLYTETKQKRLSTDVNELYIKDSYTYTNQERVLAHIHQIGTTGTPQLLAKNTYNELGQLISKNVGGTDVTGATSIQKVDYSYNIRGWMTGINKVDGSPNPLQQGNDPLDLFAFKINYNTVQNETNYVGEALYNGNISETYWRTSSDNVLRKYGYFYDDLNRLNNSVYQKPNAAVKVTNSYNESLSYDKNGNIIALQRNGEYDDPTIAIPTDNLVYQYLSNSNQLSKVTDSTNDPSGFEDGINIDDDYSYDANGNMIVDQNKGITSIKYNHLNLPSQITIANKGKIEYLYNALGQKVKKVVTDNTVSPVIITTTDYLSGFQYENSVLKFFPHAEGYVSNTVVNSVNTYKYVFNYTDHLGNIRLSYTKNTPTSAISILEENHYYPFGLKHNNYNVKIQNYAPCTFCPPIPETEIVNVPRNVYQYKFQNKEWQDELSLNLYDFGGRLYDPATVRTTTHDPLSEKFYNISQQSFLNNNPLFFTDPTGMSASPIYDTKGSFMGTDDQGLTGKAIVMKKEDFTQGMKHDDAVKKDLAPNGGTEYYKAIPDFDNYNNFYKHYNSLSTRPDYDGYLTKSEADDWWTGKSGEPLFVDQSKIDLPGVTTSNFENKKGTSFYKNFIWGLSNTGRVYGTLKLTLLNANTGSVHLGGNTFMDEYDYKMDGRPLRDGATWVGRPGGENSGKSFFIYGYGQAKVPVIK